MKKGIIVIGIGVSVVLIGLGLYGLFLNKKNNINIENNDTISKIDVLRNTLEGLKNVNNLTYELNIETDKENENSENTIKIDLGTKQHEILMLVAEQTLLHSYSIFEDGKIVNYTRTLMAGNDKYYKSNNEENESTINFDMSHINTFINNMNLFEIKDNNLFEATFTKETFNSISFNVNNSNDNNKQEIIDDVIVSVKLDENNNVEYIVYDLSNSVKIDDKIYSKYIITEKYYDIGSTIIRVPDEIKDNAIES